MDDDNYGRTVTYSTDGIFDTYTVSGNGITFTLSFITGTDLTQVYAAINSIGNTVPPVLAVAIAQNISNFENQMQIFLDSRYSTDTRMNFIGIYINAQINGLTNRQAYVAQLLTWQNAIIVAAATYVDMVSAMTNVATVQATTFNFSALTAEDPCLTPIAALQISN